MWRWTCAFGTAVCRGQSTRDRRADQRGSTGIDHMVRAARASGVLIGPITFRVRVDVAAVRKWVVIEDVDDPTE